MSTVNRTDDGVIDLAYTPRPHQAELHRRTGKYNIIVAHRGFGKTWFCIYEMVQRFLESGKEDLLYGYLAPTYGQAKRIIWDELKTVLQKIPGFTSNEQDLTARIALPDGRKLKVYVLGADNPNSLRGVHLDGIIIDEYAEMDKTVYTQVIHPATMSKKGWQIFIGTPKGSNHFYELYKKVQDLTGWFTEVYKLSQTKLLDDGEIAMLKAIMSEEEYNQEYECSFEAGVVGGYFTKALAEAKTQGRIAEIPYNSKYPVETWWDLGMSDSMVIWFIQIINGVSCAIDYIEDSGKTLDFYVKSLKMRPYLYSQHILPFDAAVRELTANATLDGKINSRAQTLKDLGLNSVEIAARHSVDDGIHAVMMMLKTAKFDENKCKRGIEALAAYQRKWDAKNKMFQSKPLHNWASHAADAYRVGAMSVNMGLVEKKNKILRREVDNSYDPFGF